MVCRSCYCGIPLQRATQYVAITDMVFGVLYFSIMIIHLKESIDHPHPKVSLSSLPTQNDWDTNHYDRFHPRVTPVRSYRTFRGIDWIPVELAVVLVITHGIQLIFGVLLYIAAVYKNRCLVTLWVIVSAVLTLLTFYNLILRIYELIVVNEFNKELAQEEVITYFPGSQPEVYPPPAPTQINCNQYQPHTYNPNQGQGQGLIRPIEPNGMPLSVISGNATPIPSPVYPQYVGYNGGIPQPPYSQPQQHQFQYESPKVPPALQPPPQYDDVVRQGQSSTGNGGWLLGGQTYNQFSTPSTSSNHLPKPTTLTIQPYCQEKSRFENTTSFSQF